MSQYLKKLLLFVPFLILGFGVFWIPSVQAQNADNATQAIQCPSGNAVGTLICEPKRFVGGQCRTEGEVTAMINACTGSRRNEVFRCSTGTCACAQDAARDCRGNGLNKCLTQAEVAPIDAAGNRLCTTNNRSFNPCSLIEAVDQCGACIGGSELIDGQCLSIGQVNTRVTTVETDVLTLEEQVNRLLNGLYTVTAPLNLAPTADGFVFSLNGCETNQVLKWDSANQQWACGNDLDTDTNTFYTAAPGGGLSLAGTVFSSVLGTSIDSSEIMNGTITLADLGDMSCVANQVLKRNAANNAWICSAIQGDNGNDSPWATQESDLSYMKGNVGIGTISPSAKLDVVGNIELTGDLDFIRGDTSKIHSLGSLSFDWTAGTYDSPDSHGIRSTAEDGTTFTDDLSINSYDNMILRLDTNADNPSSSFKIENESNANGADLFTVTSPTGNTTMAGNLTVNGANARLPDESIQRRELDTNAVTAKHITPGSVNAAELNYYFGPVVTDKIVANGNTGAVTSYCDKGDYALSGQCWATYTNPTEDPNGDGGYSTSIVMMGNYIVPAPRQDPNKGQGWTCRGKNEYTDTRWLRAQALCINNYNSYMLDLRNYPDIRLPSNTFVLPPQIYDNIDLVNPYSIDFDPALFYFDPSNFYIPPFRL